MGKGPEAIMRFRSSMDGDQKEVPQIMDRYLEFAGVGLVLRGGERVPRREILSEFLDATMTMDYDLLPWAKASIRMGNLVTLGLRRVMELPVETDARSAFVKLWAERVHGLYERGDAFPQIRWTALSNQAMLEHWTGDSEHALGLLDYVLKKRIGKEFKLEARIKKATMLLDMDRTGEIEEVMSNIPKGTMDQRLDVIRERGKR